MHAEKFGDSFDFVKRALIRGLAAPETWVVHPMLYRTKQGYPGPGGGLDIPAYETLLGLPQGAARWGNQHIRAGLAHNVRNDPDKNLFIDPDTGITMNDSRPRSKYIQPNEVLIAASSRPGCLVLVFDQSFGRNRGDPPYEKQSEKKAEYLRRFGVSCAAYFVSRVPAPTYFFWVSTVQATVINASREMQKCMGVPECRLRRFYQQDLN